MYSCPNCGGNVKFNIKNQELLCSSCDSSFAIDSFEGKDSKEYYETNILHCPQCGGELLGDDKETAVFCSFCGASNVLESRMVKEKRPEYIIPFMKTKEDCKKAYRDNLKKAIYAPSSLNKDMVADSFRGIYMPYWYYEVKKKEEITLHGGKYYFSGDYEYHEVYDLKGDLEASISGMAHESSSDFADYLGENIAPFDERDMKEFNPAYLSGFYADSADVPKDVYEKDAIEVAIDKTKPVIEEDNTFKAKAIYQNDNELLYKGMYQSKNCIGHSAMFPVWFMSYRNEDRLYYSVVNGQTGKAYGDIPADFKKYAIYTLLLALPIWLGLGFFGFLTPAMCLFLSCALLYVIASLSDSYLVSLVTRLYKEDDAGFQNKESKYLNDTYSYLDSYEKELDKNKPAKREKKGSVAAPLIRVVVMLLIVAFVGMSMFCPGSISNIGANQACAIGVGVLLVCNLVETIMAIIKIDSANMKKEIKRFLPALQMIISAILLYSTIEVAIPYYIFSVFGIVISDMLVKEVIKAHNYMCSNALPQFERKGGEDNA